MIVHDYLLRLIAEFSETLTSISNQRTQGAPEDAARSVDQELQRVFAIQQEELLRLPVAEMLHRILRAGSAQEARARASFLVSLLDETGHLEAAAGRPERALDYRLQALRLLLQLPDDAGVTESPQFVPTVGALEQSLGDAPLPDDVQALLMCHHERNGEFGRAEDALFALLDAAAEPTELREFGIGFYRRLLARPDDDLLRADLPRSEVEAGLDEFRRRTAAPATA